MTSLGIPYFCFALILVAVATGCMHTIFVTIYACMHAYMHIFICSVSAINDRVPYAEVKSRLLMSPGVVYWISKVFFCRRLLGGMSSITSTSTSVRKKLCSYRYSD